MCDLMTDIEAADQVDEVRRLRAERQRRQNDPLWAVLLAVYEECQDQVSNYAEINARAFNGTGPDACWTMPLSNLPAPEVEKAFRVDYESQIGPVTWAHLVREEIAEAFQEKEPDRLTQELIQGAALIVNWVKTVRERGW